MTAEEIKQKMKERNITQGDLVRRWKKPKVTISLLVNRRLTSERLEKRLARALGVTLNELRGKSDSASRQSA
ncbi:MAG TPA: helix-turn-helix domain-containing protein [Candidatus Acidoferrales bacterium]|nr:helix-turn-helix domain-containing protein [Candidatus Acidoferrales bacterium]